MKWDCGPSWYKKALGKAKKWQEGNAYKLKWHPYFAWLPIQVGENDCRWLEWIERKGIPWGDGTGTLYGIRDWEYRAKGVSNGS